MTSTRLAVTALAVLVTAAVYAVLLLVTGFLACGISGCSGGGYGPSYSPTATQVALLVTGASLVPAALLVLDGVGRRQRVALAAVTAAAGTALAMSVVGVGLDGCPHGTTRTTGGADAFGPGAPTCAATR